MRSFLRNKSVRIFSSTFMLGAFLFLVHPPGQAREDLTFKSGQQQVTLVELFTSQGCSSSPPAEKWLNAFTDDPVLWEKIVPAAFHVDYWDRLGWKDSFSSQQFSQRQYQYKKANKVGSVYTPGFVVNGKEWRGWFSGEHLPHDSGISGVLAVRLESKQWAVSFPSGKGGLLLHAALLGFGLQTDVKSGENIHKRLVEDFVVLDYKNFFSNKGIWRIPLFEPEGRKAKRYGMAFWVSRTNDPMPIQATGGWLPESLFR